MIPEIEKGTSQEIKTFQVDKLKEIITYVSEKSPYYRRVFRNFKISP